MTAQDNLLAFRKKSIKICIENQHLDHKQISYSVTRLANWLKQNDIKKLGILASRTFDAYIGMLAAFYAGVTHVPLNPKLPSKRLIEIVNDVKVDALVIDKKCISLVSQIIDNQSLPIICPTFIPEQTIPFPTLTRHQLANLSPLQEPVKLSQDDTAYIIYTSGSTGKPKGIEITYQNVSHYIEVLQQRYQLNENDRFAQYNELSFDVSIFDVMMAWRAGATLYVVPESQLLAPIKFIQTHGITVWKSVPSIIFLSNKLNLLKPNSLPSLRWSFFCGEPLLIKYAELWQQAAGNGTLECLYGPTETTVTCTGYRFNPKQKQLKDSQFVSIGKPYPGIYAAIINESNQYVNQSQSGELIIAGAQVAKGYLNNPSLTSKKFIHMHHPKYGLQRWYKTGDRCIQDEEGNYHYLGRIDFQHQILGHRVELEEIEHYLRAVSGLKEVVVVANQVNDHVNELVAVVCEEHADIITIKKQLQSYLPNYMVPKRIVKWPMLPRSIHGKIDRKKVRELISCQANISVPS